MSMADLLAKQSTSLETKVLRLSRGQELTGEVIAVLSQELILDLGTKAEGVMPRRELPEDIKSSVKAGDKLPVYVIISENESGQVVLGYKKAPTKFVPLKWEKFQKAINSDKVFKSKGLEVNKGGLIVEVDGIRGFVPSSQVNLSKVSNLEDLVGEEVMLNVIEVDPGQNRLIFSQRVAVSDEVKETFKKLKVGDEVSGKVAAVLPFGIFVSLNDGAEGLVHISELSWEKVEEPGKLFKIGDSVSAKIVSLDGNTHRVNLSVKQLTEDPFVRASQNYKKEDVVKGEITRINNMGVFVQLENSLEGLIPTLKIGQGEEYKVGSKVTALIDNIDSAKRRIYLSPFITTTKGLIYK